MGTFSKRAHRAYYAQRGGSCRSFEPDLAGIAPDNFPGVSRAAAEKYFEDALRKTIVENHEPVLAQLQVAEITQNIAELSVKNLQDTILAAPIVTDKSTHFAVIPNSPITGMARLGVAPIILGHVANHRTVTRAGVTLSVYAQYSYDKEKRAALDLWASRIEALLEGHSAEIVPMRRQEAQ